jgi:acyl carrier protein
VRGPLRRAAQSGGASGGGEVPLGQRLAGRSESEQDRIVLDLVRTNVALVLGHASMDAVASEGRFLESGFDSLTAVELRNRLNAASGLRLPSTLIFDCPTPAALARYLRTQVAPPSSQDHVSGLLGEVDRLEAALTAIPEGNGSAGDRDRVLKRIQALMWRFGDHRGTAPDLTEEDDGSATDYATASDDEMFSMIDEELGL